MDTDGGTWYWKKPSWKTNFMNKDQAFLSQTVPQYMMDIGSWSSEEGAKVPKTRSCWVHTASNNCRPMFNLRDLLLYRSTSNSICMTTSFHSTTKSPSSHANDNESKAIPASWHFVKECTTHDRPKIRKAVSRKNSY